MNITSTARWTGIGYLALAIAGGLSYAGIRGQLYVAADPGATLAHLTENQGLAIVGLAAEVITVIAQALAALGFFAIFRAERPTAAFGVASFGVANAVIILMSAAFNATALAVISQPSLAPGGDAAATVGLLYALSGACWTIGNIFFGLWLIPMGWFAVSTRRFPKVLGWFLIAGGIGYLLGALVGVIAPELAPTLGNALPLPATVGELWMIGYLLIVGIRRAVTSSTPAAN
jgi:hypothetical protein